MNNSLKRNSQQCWRCGSGHPLSATSVATFVGGYKAHICAECLNDWHLFANELRPFIDLLDMELAIEIVKLKIWHNGDPDKELETQLRVLVEEERFLKRDLFERAETWVALGIEPPKKES